MAIILKDGKYIEAPDSELDLPKEPPVFTRNSLFKTEIYERMTDEELAAFEEGMAQADRRVRLMWDGCQQVVTGDLFPQLKERLTEAFGPERAEEILSLKAEI